MKAAIYSRVMEEEQRPDLQLFFDELTKQKIEPIIFLNFYEQIKKSQKTEIVIKIIYL